MIRGLDGRSIAAVVGGHVYHKCRHCHLFVESNPAFGDSPGLARWVHLHRGDEADVALDASHEPEPEEEGHLIRWWREHGPAEMRARFVPPNPLDYVDYCGGACQNAVTPWAEDACDCCGRQWGSDTRADGTAPVCAGHHIIGDVWWQLLAAQAGQGALAQPEEGKAVGAVVLCGNPVDGLILYGPFDTAGEGADWADANLPGAEWWVADVHEAD